MCGCDISWQCVVKQTKQVDAWAAIKALTENIKAADIKIPLKRCYTVVCNISWQQCGNIGSSVWSNKRSKWMCGRRWH